MLPPPFSEPRKLRLLVVESVTGRSLLKLPLKLSNCRVAARAGGQPQRDIAAEGVDVQIVAVAPVAGRDADAAAESLDAHRPGDIGEPNFAGEPFDLEIAGDRRDRDRRAEGPQSRARTCVGT